MKTVTIRRHLVSCSSLAGAALLAMSTGCGSPNPGGNATGGTGGTPYVPPGTGGGVSTGGGGPLLGTGGVPATGGAPGTGGVPATSGAAATGGTGAALGSGGASAGGAAGSAGSAGNAGSGAGGAAGGSSSGGASSGGSSSGGAASGGSSSGGASSGGASSGGASSGGAAGSGGSGGSVGSLPNTNPGFTNLAPPILAPLDPNGGTALTPAAPAGWTYYSMPDTTCRDGSPAGLFVKHTTSDKLMIYVEGGGACTSPGFCNYNPANVDSAISGTGETVLGSTLGVGPFRQQPGVFELGVLNGVFDEANPANPVKDWNQVYIPYCTGDVHFGTRNDVVVQGVAAPQQFVGHFNMQKFIGRVVPTFSAKVDRVLLTGASAGSFGAALNFSMIQDAFGEIPVDVLLDSGPPFADAFMPVCMQKYWRELWGFDASLPPDCNECRQADGGGIINMADFLIRKHPNATIALVSSTQDEVIRLFFSMGENNCANMLTADPVLITTGQVFDPTIFYGAARFETGLMDLRSRFVGTGRFSTYFLGGANQFFHQHVWRARFTDTSAGTPTIAQFTQNFLDGVMAQVGP